VSRVWRQSMFGTVLFFAVLAGLAAQPFQSVPGIVPDTFVADATQVRDVETSPFGSYVAIYDASDGNSIRLFDRDLSPLWRYRMRAYWSSTWDAGSVIQFAPDESFLVFPGYRSGNDVAICNPETGEALQIITDHQTDRYVTAIALSPDGVRLVTTCGDEIFLYVRKNGLFQRAAEIRDFRPAVKSVGFLPDSRRLAISATLQQGRSVTVFDTTDETFTDVFEYRFQDGNISHDIYHLAISPDGEWIAGGYRDSLLVFRRNEDSYDLSERIDEIELDTVYTVEFSPDGTALISGHYGYLRSWQLDGSHWVSGATWATQQPDTNDLAFSGDGRWLYLASSADENALSRFHLDGFSPSDLGVVTATLHDGISIAQKRVLTESRAETIVRAVRPESFAPRDMFETEEEYTSRLEEAAIRVRNELAVIVEAQYVGDRLSRSAGDTMVLELDTPLTAPGRGSG